MDADSGLMHIVIGTAANINDVTQSHGLMHGQENMVFADAGYEDAIKRPHAARVQWQVAMRSGTRKVQMHMPGRAVTEQVEKLKARVRAKG